MQKFRVLDQVFVVPVNSTIELSPEAARLHAPRIVEQQDGTHLTIEPVFLKPGTEFGMEGEFPRAILNALEPIEDEPKKAKKGKKEPETPEGQE